MDIRRSRLILADFIRQIRAEANISPAKLSQQIGEREDFIARVEKGIARLGIVEFFSIAEALGRDRVATVQEFERYYELREKERDPQETYISDFVRRYRRRANLTQIALSLKMGKSPNYIRTLERRGRYLLLDDFIAFAHAIGADPEALARECAKNFPCRSSLES